MFATVSMNSILNQTPCEDGLKAFKLKFGHLDPDAPVPLLACLESNPVPDVVWALRAVHQDVSSVLPLIAADFAESVLHVFEEKFPEDDRPRKAIEAARVWAMGKDRDAARDAADAARDAAFAAVRDAADAARDAADAAYNAAYAAYAADAAFAAAYATHNAAYNAAYAASAAAEHLKQAEILHKYFSQTE